MEIVLDIPAAIKRLDAVRGLVAAKEMTDFWHQCVRDIDNKWGDYTKIRSLEGTRYFYGHQPSIDYSNKGELNLLLVNINIRTDIYITLQNDIPKNVADFQNWIISLRSKMEYRPTEEWKLDIHATTTHTDIVKQDVIRIAREYEDPYAKGIVAGPVFTEFPDAAQPKDEADGEYIRHTYPSLEYKDIYFEAAHLQLLNLLSSRHTKQSYIYGVALLYQLLINLHYFPSINTSLYMNIVNGLLEIAGIKGVDHGIKDFVAMRLQPNNYQRYFYDEVIVRNG